MPQSNINERVIVTVFGYVRAVAVTNASFGGIEWYRRVAAQHQCMHHVLGDI